MAKRQSEAAEATASEAQEASGTIIVPTIGRVLWYTPKVDGSCGEEGLVKLDDQPMVALVNYVHDDRKVNVVGFDHDGNPFGFREVELIQDADLPKDEGHFVSWMPYQIGQAKKHAVEAPAAE